MDPILVNCFYNNVINSGNPAAVILDYKGDDDKKLVIAAELNLPVTVFVSESKSDQPLIEYFYPNSKMPLCLHGTLAAAGILLKRRNIAKIKFITSAGKVLKVIQDDSKCLQVEVSAQQMDCIDVTIDAVLTMLSIDEQAILKDMPLIIASVGGSKLLVPIASRKILNALNPNFSCIAEWSKANKVNGVYAYTPASTPDRFYARGFNPKAGHNEDAATGVAAAALSLTLKKDIVVEQGSALGKPCTIEVKYVTPESIWVGGKVSIK